MKTVTTIAAILAIVLALAAAGFIYPATMEVVHIDNESDEVYLMTYTGFVYVMTGTEDWMEGDIASLLMFSNGTSTIQDDVIISSRFSGWVADEFC